MRIVSLVCQFIVVSRLIAISIQFPVIYKQVELQRSAKTDDKQNLEEKLCFGFFLGNLVLGLFRLILFLWFFFFPASLPRYFILFALHPPPLALFFKVESYFAPGIKLLTLSPF